MSASRSHRKHSAGTVTITGLDLELPLAAGERIQPKRINTFRECATGRETGYTYSRTWLDSQKRFSSNLLLASD